MLSSAENKGNNSADLRVEIDFWDDKYGQGINIIKFAKLLILE